MLQKKSNKKPEEKCRQQINKVKENGIRSPIDYEIDLVNKEDDDTEITEKNKVVIMKERDNEKSQKRIEESNLNEREIELEDEYDEDISDDSSINTEENNSDKTLSAFSDNMMQYKEKLNEKELTKLKKEEEFLYKSPNLNKTDKLGLDIDYTKSPTEIIKGRDTLVRGGNNKDNLIDTMVVPDYITNKLSEVNPRDKMSLKEKRKNSFEDQSELDFENEDNINDHNIKQYESNFGDDDNYIRESDI